jgi:hypothetical protein
MMTSPICTPEESAINSAELVLRVGRTNGKVAMDLERLFLCQKTMCPAVTERARLILTMLGEFNLQGCFVTIPTKV